MNVIKERQEDRLRKVGVLINTLKLCKEKGKEVDEVKLVMNACHKWGISKRTAKEYLEIAKYQVK